MLLLEKGDYGGGTSGASSWMIHGGPRYLEFDWRTTRLSAEDAGKIVTIARHMVHRVVFLIPVMPGDKHNIERLETAMEVYDRFQPLKLSNRHLRLTTEEALELEPGLTDRMVGAMTMEEWGVDPHRLTFANVQDPAIFVAGIQGSHTYAKGGIFTLSVTVSQAFNVGGSAVPAPTITFSQPVDVAWPITAFAPFTLSARCPGSVALTASSSASASSSSNAVITGLTRLA